MGGSFGGSVSLVAGAKSKDIKKIVSVSAPIDYRERIKLDLEQRKKTMKRGFENTWRIKNEKVWDTIVKVSPIRYVNALKNKDVLLVHGKKDDIINYKESLTLFEKIKSGRGRHELILPENLKHGGASIISRRNIFSKVMKFIK